MGMYPSVPSGVFTCCQVWPSPVTGGPTTTMGVLSNQARTLSFIWGVARTNTPVPSVLPTRSTDPMAGALASVPVGDGVGGTGLAVGAEVGAAVGEAAATVGDAEAAAGAAAAGVGLGATCWGAETGGAAAPPSATPWAGADVGATSASCDGEVGRGLGVTVGLCATAEVSSGEVVATLKAIIAPPSMIARIRKKGAAFTTIAILSDVRSWLPVRPIGLAGTEARDDRGGYLYARHS